MQKLPKRALIAAAALVAVAASAEPYTRLFRIMNPQGSCLVRRPDGGAFQVGIQYPERDSTAFEPAVKGKAYPFGTSVSCGPESSAILLFTDTDAVRLLADTDANVILEPSGSRVVDIKRGLAVTRIGANTTNDAVVIDTPLGRMSSLTGNCKVEISELPPTKTEPGRRVVELRAEPASNMKFVGPQYVIPILKNGFGARVVTTADDSYSVVTDLLGDYKVYVNTGVDPDPPGDPDAEDSPLTPIKMSTKSELRIWRRQAPVGGRTIVSVLATTPAGKGRESFAFAVGKASIAARSNVFMDTVTNELAQAAAKA